MFNGLSTLLRLVSRAACLIVIASFALFAIDQAGSASAKQQDEVNSAAPASLAAGSPAKPAAKHGEGQVRRTLDDASEVLTSPFSGVTSQSSNDWVVRGGNLVLALLLYGFGLGFLARVLRVRV